MQIDRHVAGLHEGNGALAVDFPLRHGLQSSSQIDPHGSSNSRPIGGTPVLGNDRLAHQPMNSRASSNEAKLRTPSKVSMDCSVRKANISAIAHPSLLGDFVAESLAGCFIAGAVCACARCERCKTASKKRWSAPNPLCRAPKIAKPKPLTIMLLDALTTDRFGAVAPKYSHAFRHLRRLWHVSIAWPSQPSATIKPIQVSLLIPCR